MFICTCCRTLNFVFSFFIFRNLSALDRNPRTARRRRVGTGTSGMLLSKNLRRALGAQKKKKSEDGFFHIRLLSLRERRAFFLQTKSSQERQDLPLYSHQCRASLKEK